MGREDDDQELGFILPALKAARAASGMPPWTPAASRAWQRAKIGGRVLSTATPHAVRVLTRTPMKFWISASRMYELKETIDQARRATGAGWRNFSGYEGGR